MKIEITEKKENLLQERTEVRFTVDHTGEATPTRKAVIDEISKMVKAKKGTVVINNIDTQYGRGISKGYAKVYKSEASALKFEREYLLKRSGIGQPQAPPKDGAAPAAPAAEAPAAEVPAEVPAEEPVEVPVEVPAEEPAEVPAEVPAEEPVEVPVEVPAEEPAEVPAEVPAKEE